MVILKLKSSVTAMTNSLNRFNSRYDMIPESISKFEYKSRENIQSEEHREKRLKKKKHSFSNLWYNIKCTKDV